MEKSKAREQENKRSIHASLKSENKSLTWTSARPPIKEKHQKYLDENETKCVFFCNTPMLLYENNGLFCLTFVQFFFIGGVFHVRLLFSAIHGLHGANCQIRYMY